MTYLKNILLPLKGCKILIFLFIFSFNPIFPVKSFFPDYELILNGGKILLNGYPINIVSDKKKEKKKILPESELSLGEDGYILLKNNLGHFIIVTPNTSIRFLKSPFKNHSYIYLKKGTLLIENLSKSFNRDINKVQVRIQRGLLSFPQGRFYIDISEEKDHLIVLNGSGRYLSYKEFKIILNGPQSIYLNNTESEISHFIPKEEAFSILNIGSKLFKYSDLKLLYDFKYLIEKKISYRPIPLEDFLPPLFEKYQVKLIMPNLVNDINLNKIDRENNVSVSKETYLKVTSGIHQFEWNQQFESVSVKHFPQIVVSINNNSYIKDFSEEIENDSSVESSLTPNIGNIQNISPSTEIETTVKKGNFESLNITGVKLNLNKLPDFIEFSDPSKNIIIDPPIIKITDKNRYIVKLNPGKYYLQVEKKGFKANVVDFVLKSNQFRHINIDFFKPYQYKLIKEYGNKFFPLNFPIGIAVDDKNLYVADSGNKKIRFYKNREVSNILEKVINLKYPYSIVYRYEHLLISDPIKNVVFLFNKDLEEKRRITLDQNISRPLGIDYDGQSIYIVDSGNNVVKKFTRGKVDIMGKNYKLKKPIDVLVRNKGGIVISDSGDNCLLVFNLKGELIKVIPLNYSPKFIAENDKGYLYITDPQGSRVNVYDESFSIVSSLEIKGGTPYSVVVQNDSIYVSVRNLHVVQVYKEIYH